MNVFDRVNNVEKEVQENESRFDNDPSDQNLVTLKKVNACLLQALSMEEAFWKQKAAIKWAEDGERNTKYFHNLVKKWRHRTVIHKIVAEEGHEITQLEPISESTIELFQQLLTEQEGSQGISVTAVLDHSYRFGMQ